MTCREFIFKLKKKTKCQVINATTPNDATNIYLFIALMICNDLFANFLYIIHVVVMVINAFLLLFYLFFFSFIISLIGNH